MYRGRWAHLGITVSQQSATYESRVPRPPKCKHMHIYLYWLARPPTCQVTQHETCRVRVTVLNETSDPEGGHKFKLSGERLMSVDERQRP